MPSQNDLDTAKANLARYKADEASAKASVAQAQAALDVNRTDLTKAVDQVAHQRRGIEARRSSRARPWRRTFQSPTLFTLAEDLTQMELQVDVDEADVGQVREGQEATFTVDAYPDRTFPARITQVRYGSQTVEGVVTYKTVLKVDNSQPRVASGDDGDGGDHGEQAGQRRAGAQCGAAIRADDEGIGGSARGAAAWWACSCPRPPGMNDSKIEEPDTKKKEQQVWTVRDGQLAALSFTKG